jgi:hypothetical protein
MIAALGTLKNQDLWRSSLGEEFSIPVKLVVCFVAVR